MFDLFGSWDLRHYSHVVDEVSASDDDTVIQAWLRGSDSPSLDAGSETTGLQLFVNKASFSEHAREFTQLMFDAEGIQVNQYQPMSGKMVIADAIGFLIPEGVPEYARSRSWESKLRYDDGDTTVCDTIRGYRGLLVRQLSVATDELYLDRMTLAYCRASDVK